jgi:hypothetical protein
MGSAVGSGKVVTVTGKPIDEHTELELKHSVSEDVWDADDLDVTDLHTRVAGIFESKLAQRTVKRRPAK